MLAYKLQYNHNYQIVNYIGLEQGVADLHLKPDVILVDYKLLEPDANELLELIKERLPETSIIILYDAANKYLFEELKNYNECELLATEPDSVKFTDKVIQKINSLIEKKRNKKKSLKQKMVLFGVGLIALVLSIVLFLF
jgi:response regulator RpfG family c-di-GMP phosphodiesterase